ncbi:PREDICTED: deoxycytidylate deaminase-like isoform X3 [Nicrophorus vespilloides]|uniref:dCMP deaminase n=1 Tax=Nicrophorus vespilloides TaxID=110193 RepID=A0ABM1NEJ2_NICVS|nr:PREDICTED: deoxycytidylate deaminase-like isoform X3 [Nicrophorus vespilloides]
MSEKVTEDNSSQNNTSFINDDQYFMAVALLAAKRSHDRETKVGACIINEDKKIVGIGYNGMPNGCRDRNMSWNKNKSIPLDNKHSYVCHAELNAILNKNSADLKNCKIYVTLFPCNECAKCVINSGITEVVYISDKYSYKAETIASKEMLNAANIKYSEWEGTFDNEELLIDFN